MSRPPRFSVARAMLAGDSARVAGSEFHHMCTVMRLTSGAEVNLLCDDGAEYEGRIDQVGRDYAIVKIAPSSRRNTPSRRLIIAPALIKAARMDFLIEKAAELGATELRPLICSRSVVRDPGLARLARWRRLAASAAKQSLAPATMEIREPLDVCALAGDTLTNALRIICDSEGDPLGAIVKRAAPAVIVLACGPEGGFAPAERAALESAGFVPAALGGNRLRSETAALAALAIAAAALDEMNRGD